MTNSIPSRSGPSFRSTLLLGGALGAIVFLVAAVFSRLNVDVHHQGIMFASAARFLAGAPIYADNFFYYGSVTPALNALGILLFGKQLVVLQWMTAACYGGVAVVLWRIWSRFLPWTVAFGLVFLGFLLAPFLYWEFHPWSSVYALLFLVLATLYMIKWIEQGRAFDLALAGIFVGLVFWTRQSVGNPLAMVFFLLVAFLPYYLKRGNSGRLKPLLNFLAGSGLALLLGVGGLQAVHSFRDWFHACITSR